MEFPPLMGFVFFSLFVAWGVGGHYLTSGAWAVGESAVAFKYIQYGWLAVALVIPLVIPLLHRVRARLSKKYSFWKTTEYGLWVLGGSILGYYWNGGVWVVSLFLGAFILARWGPFWRRKEEEDGKQVVLFLVRIFLALLIFWVSYRNRGLPVFDLYDDGPRLAAVNQFLLGGIPHKDFFIHYGLIREVIQPLIAFKLWGESYEAILRLSQGMVALNFVLLFLICSELYSSTLFALWVGLVLLLRVDLFLPERVFPLLLASYFLIAAFRTKNTPENLTRQNRFLFLGGFLALGTCLYSLEIGVTFVMGVALALAFGFYLKLRDPSTMSVGKPILGGFVFGTGILFIWLWHTGAISYFFSDVHGLLFSRMSTWADKTQSHLFKGIREIFNTPRMRSTFVYLNFPMFLSLAAITGVCSTSTRDSQTRSLFQILILACVLFSQFTIYIGRSDYIHWKNATSLLWPLMLLVTIYLCRSVESSELNFTSKFLRWASVGLLVLPLIFGFAGRSSFGSFTSMGFHKILYPPASSVPRDEPVILRLGNIPLSVEQRLETADVVKRVKEIVPADGYFFDFTNYGGYYFLTERKNPTRFGLINYISSSAMLEECKKALIRFPPDGILVELDHERWVYRKDLAPLAQFVQRSFVLGQRFGRFGIFVPQKKEARVSSPTPGGV